MKRATSIVFSEENIYKVRHPREKHVIAEAIRKMGNTFFPANLIDKTMNRRSMNKLIANDFIVSPTI
jgi:hypothetical protein